VRLDVLFAGRLAAAALSFLFGGITFVATPAASAESARPISTLSLDDRMHLPAATIVQLQSGRIASLGVLRAEHEARMVRFAQAAALGQSAGTRLTAPAAFTVPQSLGTSAGFTMGLVSTQGVVPLPSPASGASAVVAVPIATWGTDGYAQDYLDFCSNVGASACIYLPANTTYNYVFPQGSNPVTDTYNVADTDPLILDLQACISRGGSLYPGEGCVYRYPVNYFANFTPGRQPPAMAAFCSGPASYFVDPQGAVRVNYQPPGATFTTGSSAIVCALQVFVTP